MTFQEFTRYLLKYQAENLAQRKGQAAFNALWYFHPQLADAIRGGMLDPFYDDQRLTAFLNYVEEHWA